MRAGNAVRRQAREHAHAGARFPKPVCETGPRPFMPSSLSPLTAYQQAVTRGEFHADRAQQHAATQLDHCLHALHQQRQPRGVYLWGPVGRGKTWLMDRFHAALDVPATRQHFHHFMRHVHRRLFALTGHAEPLQTLADELAATQRVLCFDELFINDIGDAMILGPLLQALFARKVVLVITSNQPPDQLYADGFNRERLLPAIATLQRELDVIRVDGGVDHRLHPGVAETRYWLMRDTPPDFLHSRLLALSEDEPISDTALHLGHQIVAVRGRSRRALWCRFADLCAQPLSALDFVALGEQISVLLLDEVPKLSSTPQAARIARGTEDGVERIAAGDRQLPPLSKTDDAVRRFIALIDECYDRGIPVYVRAEVGLDDLYQDGYLAFAFRRTHSRLREMQWHRFGRDAAG